MITYAVRDAMTETIAQVDAEIQHKRVEQETAPRLIQVISEISEDGTEWAYTTSFGIGRNVQYIASAGLKKLSRQRFDRVNQP